MGKHDAYIITSPRPLELTHYRLPPEIRQSVVWGDSSVAEGMCNMECIWYYQPLDGPPRHVEPDTDEILCFIGTNHEDPSDLGGTVEFCLEDEWITLTKSCFVFVPQGMYHCPFRVTEVRSPILHIAVTPQRKLARRRAADGSHQGTDGAVMQGSQEEAPTIRPTQQGTEVKKDD